MIKRLMIPVAFVVAGISMMASAQPPFPGWASPAKGAPAAAAADPATPAVEAAKTEVEPVQVAKVGTTLENLQTAFNGESNAKARYEAFAAKADEEGYKSVATLFRAAALAESIHATKHEAAIKALGGEAKAIMMVPEVKSTKENLEAALKGEGTEKSAMYPAFVKQAEADKNGKAVYSFKGAMAAEVEHFSLFEQALGNMEGWKAPGKAFIVCKICGWTKMEDPALTQCPVCSAPRSKFTIVK